MGFFKNWFDKSPKQEDPADKEGWSALGTTITDLEQKFAAQFDGSDRSKTEDVYRVTQRIQELFLQPVTTVIWSGAFGSEGSALGVAGRQEEPYRADKQRQCAESTQRIVEGIDTILQGIYGALPAAAFQGIPADVIPLQSKLEERRDARGPSSLQLYADELRGLLAVVRETVQPLQDTPSAKGLILPVDFRTLANIRRTLLVDRAVWSAMLAESRSTSIAHYNSRTIADFKALRQRVMELCEKHERAFSKSGFSQGDSAFAWLTGMMSAEDAKKSVLDDDRVFHFDIQKASVESLQFLNIFGVTIKDFVGKTEKEIKTIIRPTYYRLVKECHPDLHPGNEKKEAEFKKLSEAYETLIDPDKRAMYFQTGGKK